MTNDQRQEEHPMFKIQGSAAEMFTAVLERMKRTKPPSQRDQEIAAAVRRDGRRHADVAAEHHLSRRRVSQICHEVQRWHSWTQPWERGELDGPGGHRARRVLHEQQLVEVYRRAMRAFARSEQPLTTKRRGQRDADTGGPEESSDRCQREPKPDTGSLRVALQAIQLQWKLADRPSEKGDDKPEADQDRDYLTWILSVLADLREDAEERGAVPPGGPQAAVERAMRELLGVGTAGDAREGEAREGEAREGEAPAEPWTLLDEPAVAPREGEAPAEPPATWVSSSQGNAWETAWETAREMLPIAPVEDVSRLAAELYGATNGIAEARETPLGSAREIEKGNERDGVGSLWPNEALDHGNASPAKDGGPLGVDEPAAAPDPHPHGAAGPPKPTKMERLLASGRRISPAWRRRLEGQVTRRREGTAKPAGSGAERAREGPPSLSEHDSP